MALQTQTAKEFFVKIENIVTDSSLSSSMDAVLLSIGNLTIWSRKLLGV